jgi:ribosome recycling factor
MAHTIVNECSQHMDKRIKTLENDLKKVRTGRASISLLDGVKVDYYGSPTPINQVGNLSTPDARTILVAPFEKKMIGEIEKAIMKADLGVQPNNDGNVVRIPIPQLTEDRRKDLVKTIKKIGEEAKIAVRNVRRDSNEKIKKIEKDKEVTEDESKKLQADIQKATDQFITLIDERMATKEKEVLTV